MILSSKPLYESEDYIGDGRSQSIWNVQIFSEFNKTEEV